MFKSPTDTVLDTAALASLLDDQMKRGLTCGLEYVGITGMKYVELDYIHEEKNFQPLPRPQGVAGCYIPSRPSIFQNIVKLINQSLNNIASIDMPEISREMTGVLKRTNEILGNPRIGTTLENLERISGNLDHSVQNFNRTLTPQKLDEMFNLITADLRNFNDLIAQAKKEIDRAKIASTTESFRNSLNSVSETKIAIINTLQRLDQSLDALTEFINSVDDDPSSLLRGKQKSPIMDKNDQLKRKYLPQPINTPQP